MKSERLLRPQPLFHEKIWGGERMRSVYGYDIPSAHTGECWAISAHKNGDCPMLGGWEGQTMGSLWRTHRELFGGLEGDVFPLLIKIIDARDDLSVQVHPDDKYAAEHENGSLGKTECWYVLQAEEGTKMVMGHHAETKEDFVKAIEEDDYDHLLNSFQIEEGNFFYIPSGTLHAICSGSLIYEAQQSSDITYRVYDYHRKDADGNERELHVKQSIDVTTVPSDNSRKQTFEKTALSNGEKTRYVESEFFKVDKYEMNGENVIANDAPFQMISILDGEGTMEGMDVSKGEHFIICSDQKETSFCGNMEIMKKTKKGEKPVDLRPHVHAHRLLPDGEGCFLRLSAGSEANIKPELLLSAYGQSLGLSFPAYAFLMNREEVYAADPHNAGAYIPLEAFGERFE